MLRLLSRFRSAVGEEPFHSQRGSAPLRVKKLALSGPGSEEQHMGHFVITDPEGEHAFHASNVRGAERNSRKPQNVRGVQKCQRSTARSPLNQ